jgi:hypothetical protein
MDTMLSGLYRIPLQVLARLDVESVVHESPRKPIISATEWLDTSDSIPRFSLVPEVSNH